MGAVAATAVFEAEAGPGLLCLEVSGCSYRVLSTHGILEGV